MKPIIAQLKIDDIEKIVKSDIEGKSDLSGSTGYDEFLDLIIKKNLIDKKELEEFQKPKDKTEVEEKK